MKAVYIERHGGPEVLEYGDVPDPVAGAGRGRRRHCRGKRQRRRLEGARGQLRRRRNFPTFWGAISPASSARVGEGVTDFEVGDPVFGVATSGQEGAYAEKIAIKAAIVAKKPAGLSHIEAAALALTGLTALVSVEDTLKLKARRDDPDPGRGGRRRQLRHPARQAHRRARDHHRERREPRLSCAGSAPIRSSTTTREDFTKVVSGCDAVFDTVGGDVAQRSFAVLKPGGRAAFIASGAQAPKPPRGDVSAAAAGRTRPRRISSASRSWSRQAPCASAGDQALSALGGGRGHRVSEGRHFRGKLVFQIR